MPAAPAVPDLPLSPSEPPSPRVEILDVSPALAEAWLAKNRTTATSQGGRRGYARDMLAGRWSLNGETVKLDVNGHLRDGQHRLNAVVVSGATVPMVVVSNLGTEVMQTVDAGRETLLQRRAQAHGRGQHLTPCRGRQAGRHVGARHEDQHGRIRPTPLEMTAFIEEHPEIRSSADLASKPRAGSGCRRQ